MPEVGYVLGWLASPVGIFALGLYAAFLVSIVVRGTPGSRRSPSVAVSDRRRTSGARHRAARPVLGLPFLAVLRRRRYVPRHRVAPAVAAPVVVTPRRRKAVARHRVARPTLSLPLAAVSTALTVVTLVAGTLALGWTEPTLAAWTEPVTVSGTKQTAYTVPAPNGDLHRRRGRHDQLARREPHLAGQRGAAPAAQLHPDRHGHHRDEQRRQREHEQAAPGALQPEHGREPEQDRDGHRNAAAHEHDELDRAGRDAGSSGPERTTRLRPSAATRRPLSSRSALRTARPGRRPRSARSSAAPPAARPTSASAGRSRTRRRSPA